VSAPWLGLLLACVTVAIVVAAWCWDANTGGVVCQDEEGARPVSAEALAGLGVFLGGPFALAAGALAGALAAWLRWGRRIALCAVALGCASIVPLLARGGDCDAAELMWYQAATPAVIAALLLESATRRDPRIPLARCQR
jgi:hypothetical protein